MTSFLESSEGKHHLKVAEYIDAVWDGMDNIEHKVVVSIANVLHSVRDTGGTVYVAGNGGSAANALHLAGHLTMLGFRVECPIANPVALTAASNDYGYGNGLFQQIRKQNLASGVFDACVVLSCSAYSRNVVMFETQFKSIHGFDSDHRTIALTGDMKNRSKEIRLNSDIELRVASDNYGVIEDVHSVVIHIIRELLIAKGLTEPAR